MESFQNMLEEMTVRLEANAGHIEMTFPFFITKRAPRLRRGQRHGLPCQPDRRTA